MARTKDAPSHRAYSHFRCEEATISDVNRSTYTVAVTTTHSSKDVLDIQCLAPYHHYANGEGIHHLPEVGAKCFLAWPSDNSPPFIMGYIGAASELRSDDGEPIQSTEDGEGSETDASFKSNRPDLNPGDIGFTTRDENFIILRRGGVLQLGATPVAQRIYLPILNYIKDFAENYDLTTFGGDVSWTVGRSEDDPSSNAPATYTFHMNEFAQDAKASLRITHYPLQGGDGSDKTAWEVVVAPQGISRQDGSVEGEVYRLLVATSGDVTELIGASRDITIKGDDSLSVSGDRSVSVDGDEAHKVGGDFEVDAVGNVGVKGAKVSVGSLNATEPGLLGYKFLAWVGSRPFIAPPGTAGGPVNLNPAAAKALTDILSSVVFLK